MAGSGWRGPLHHRAADAAFWFEGHQVWQGRGRHRKSVYSLDRVNRQFTADQPNQLWVSDLTYVSAWQTGTTWPLCLMSTLDGSWAGGKKG